MKEILGLVVFLLLTGTAVWMAVSRRVSNGFAAGVLVFALVSGWTIANYDWIRTAKWEIPGAADALKRISEARDATLAEIRKESQDRKNALDSLASGVIESSEKVALQRKEIDAIMEDLKAREQKITALSEKIGQSVEQAAALQRASSDLSLLMTKAIWLQTEAKDEYGEDRAQVAMEELLNQLDEVVKLAITDADARAKFTSSVMNSLPPRQ